VNTKSKSSLSAEEVCRILAQCARARVRVLQFADLYVRFDDLPGEIQVRGPENVKLPQVQHPDTEISAIQTQTEKQAILQDEIAIRQEQLTQMFIENPLEAEKMLLSGEAEIHEEQYDEEA
jgi:hypothetical protein